MPLRPGRPTYGFACTIVSGNCSAPAGVRYTRVALTSPASTPRSRTPEIPSSRSQVTTRDPRPLASTTKSAASTSSAAGVATRTPRTRRASPTRPTACALRITAPVRATTAERTVKSSRARVQLSIRGPSCRQRRSQPSGVRATMPWPSGISRAPAVSSRSRMLPPGISSSMAARPPAMSRWA